MTLQSRDYTFFPDQVLVIDIGSQIVKLLKVSKESNKFRIDIVDDNGSTTHAMTFPDDKADWKDERIKTLEARLEAIREAGGWYPDPGNFDEDI